MSSIMDFAFCILILVAVLPFNNAYIPRMLNGRPRGGFLGIPGGFQEVSSVQDPPENWFVQPLNHFDQSDSRTWKQKYFVNSTHYRKGGPLFVQIGGEGKANPIWVTHGAWMEYAQTFNAYSILVEHRFYGDSHPTSDMSTANLKYLSSEQALADLADIISHFKKQLNGVKVIVFGGSYSGALAAWFRMKYPFLADGAVASSAPVLAKLDFKGVSEYPAEDIERSCQNVSAEVPNRQFVLYTPHGVENVTALEYLEVVDASLNTYGQKGECNSNINMANALISLLLKSSSGRSELKKLFQLCSDIDETNQNDISNLFETLGGNFFGVVQYNKDNRAFEGAKDTSITIDTVCAMMNNASMGTPIKRYAAVNSMMLKIHGEKCQDFKYASMIKDMQAVAWNSSAAEGGRQWVYQTCTEFAYFQSSDSKKQPFGDQFPLKFSVQQCADIYGSELTKAVIAAAVNNTNTHYGGLGLQLTRVVFPNGSIDPWHALGILKDLNPEATAIFIKGTAHCANMYPPSIHDLPELMNARTEIKKNIAMWLI